MQAWKNYSYLARCCWATVTRGPASHDSRHESQSPLVSVKHMTGKLNIECGLQEVGDVMLCAHCRKATTLFRERCLNCGESNVFTVRDVFDGKVNLAELSSEIGVDWIAAAIDQLFASISTPGASRPLAA